MSRELNLDIQTVRRFANAACAEELLGKDEHRSTKLDAYIDMVNQRWNEGVTSAEAITAALRALGFKGSAQTVRRYLRPFRLPGTSRSHPDPRRRNPAPAAPAVPKPRTISRALLTHPDHLTEDDALILKNATVGAPTSSASSSTSAPPPRSWPSGAARNCPPGEKPSKPTTCPNCAASPLACAATCPPSSTA